MKKWLSLMVCALLIMSTMGIFSVAAATTVTETITIDVGANYLLPTELGGEAVTWTDISGTTVTAADTSKVGYKLYTGITESGETVTYRVNVNGEINMLVADMEDYEIGSTPIAASGHSAQSGEVIAYENGESGNKVLKSSAQVAAPSRNGYSGFLLSEAYDGDFSISLRFKAANWAKSSLYFYSSSESAGAFGNSDFGGPYIYIDSSKQVRVAIGNLGASTGAIDTTTMKVTEGYDVGSFYVTVGNIKSEDGWIDLKVSYDMDKQTYAIYVADMETPVVYDIPYLVQASSVIQVGYRLAPASGDTMMIDDIKFSRTAYVTDDLSTKSVTGAKVPEGDNSPKTAKIDLSMSDGTTQAFAVNYTPNDTAVAGSTHTVDGTIEGFSETVPVTYVVAGTTYETVNTYIGEKLTLPGVSEEIDTTVMGRKRYTGETEMGKVEYTVNIGRFDERHSDEMETHTTKPADDTYAEGLTPGVVKDGFKLETKMNDLTKSDSGSAVAATKDGDGALLYKSDSAASVNGNLTWKVIDTFDGSFRVSMDIKVENASTQGYKPFIRLYDSNGAQITNGVGPRIIKDGNEKILSIRGNGDGGTNGVNAITQTYIARVAKDCGYNVSWTRNDGAAADTADTKNSSDWFNLRFDVNSDKKIYDVYVNDILVEGGIEFFNSAANGNLGKITMAFRDVADAGVYIDNLKVYQYNCFTDELPESLDVVVGQGVAAPQETEVALTLSNGGLWKPKATVNVDASELGIQSATVAIEGFDEEIPANVKVCNYHVDTISYKNGEEFATGASVGSTMASAAFTNKSGIAGGKAFFAWYSKEGKLQTVKVVDIPAIAKDETKTVDVGLKLPADSEKVIDGKLKVFIFNDLDTLNPIDIVSEIAYQAPKAPTVHLAGASDIETYTDFYFPRTGIGQTIGNYFVDGVTINNKARSGDTTQSFVDAGLWESIVSAIKPGDYTIVCFAGNDQVKCAPQSEDLGKDCVYGENAKMFIDNVRAKGGNIIFLNGISRRTQGIDGISYDTFNHHGKGPHNHLTQLETICAENNVPLIDTVNLSAAYLQEMVKNEGEAATKKLYMQDIVSAEGVYSDNISYYQASPLWAGSRFNTAVDANYIINNAPHNDATHYTVYGANVYADMIVDAITEKYPTIELVQFIDSDAEPKAYPGF